MTAKQLVQAVVPHAELGDNGVFAPTWGHDALWFGKTWEDALTIDAVSKLLVRQVIPTAHRERDEQGYKVWLSKAACDGWKLNGFWKKGEVLGENWQDAFKDARVQEYWLKHFGEHKVDVSTAEPVLQGGASNADVPVDQKVESLWDRIFPFSCGSVEHTRVGGVESTTVTTGIDATLAERGKRYGSFDSHARITQNIKRAMQNSPNWGMLSDDMKEALEMAAHKIGRILNGDPTYSDSWTDLVGYPRLVEKRLQQERGEAQYERYASTGEIPPQQVVVPVTDDDHMR